MPDSTPVLEEAPPRSTHGSGSNHGGSRGPREEGNEDRNNRGNFTRNLNKEPDEQVARKMFFGGLVLLPWLHLVNVIFFRKQLTDPSINPQVTLWVRRSLMSFVFMTILFIAWAVLFQLKWKDFGWQSLVMVVPDEDEDAGW